MQLRARSWRGPPRPWAPAPISPCPAPQAPLPPSGQGKHCQLLLNLHCMHVSSWAESAGRRVLLLPHPRLRGRRLRGREGNQSATRIVMPVDPRAESAAAETSSSCTAAAACVIRSQEGSAHVFDIKVQFSWGRKRLRRCIHPAVVCVPHCRFRSCLASGESAERGARHTVLSPVLQSACDRGLRPSAWPPQYSPRTAWLRRPGCTRLPAPFRSQDPFDMGGKCA